MRVLVRCRFNESEELLDVAVGDGRKSFKWLGLVAAQRFVALAKPEGRRRHREIRKNNDFRYTNARLLPSRVLTEGNPFCHPDNLLCNEVADGDEVTVLLTDKMAVDGVGRPAMDRWMYIAFETSDHMKGHRQSVLDQEYKVLQDIKRANEHELHIKAAAIAHEKAMQMKKLIRVQLFSPDKIIAAFDTDWAKIDNPVSQPIDKVVGSPSEQQRIRDMLRENYLSISELFKSYSSAGSGARTDDMDFMEFSVFMYDSKIFPASKSREVIERMFQECCNNGLGRGTNATTGMKLHEFFLALIKMALLKYQVAGAGDVKSYHMGPTAEGGRRAETAQDAVKWLLEEFVTPMVEQKLSGLQVKRALERDDILALLFDHHDNMRAVFDKYGKSGSAAAAAAAAASANGASSSDATGSGSGGAMSALNEESLDISGFGMILEDARLLGGKSKSEDELTIKEARQAFAGAQHALCGEDEMQALSSSNSLGPKSPRGDQSQGGSQDQMSYAEFLEGVARVAMLKWEDPTIPLFNKMQWALESVGALAAGGPSHEPHN